MDHIAPTDGMTSALAEAMEEALMAMHLMVRFSTGDVMSAALHIMVDAGMRAVEEGRTTREQLIEDICGAARKAVCEHGREGSLQ
jgi:hypothetical protein